MKPNRRTFLATASLAAMHSLSSPVFLPAAEATPYQSANAGDFYRPADPAYSIVESVADSLRFTTRRCLTTYRGNLCATSTFVDPDGVPALWHEFGALEGVGWAANCVGGAAELLHYARVFNDPRLQAIGVSVLHHALEGGFFQEDGFVLPYRDTHSDSHFLNYMHEKKFNNWFCPGSIAHIVLQLLWAADEVPNPLRARLHQTALRTADWLWQHVKPAENGWYPRRLQPDGSHANYNAWGGEPDPQWDHSGDGTYLLWLWTELTQRGLRDYRAEIKRAAGVFHSIGGAFGSINHDTYDDHENVAYSVGFRTLARAANVLRDPKLYDWALEHCLHGLEQFEMKDDRNGVQTRGLLYMEASWDTSYLWENAEAAMALLEAARATRNADYERKGVTILRSAALHHHGEHGFLTEGVDWNNHNAQWREVDGQKIPIHVGGVEFGDVNYTQPFLNNMHITTPTLFYLETLARQEDTAEGVRYYDMEDNLLKTRAI
ncbi:MAG: hypothetical protein RBU29_11460 [bacterium]|jgi:hypothetical protein|nr:hypothetical protein [bacterium]